MSDESKPSISSVRQGMVKNRRTPAKNKNGKEEQPKNKRSKYEEEYELFLKTSSDDEADPNVYWNLDDPIKASTEVFKFMLTPVTPDKFLKIHWEKKPLHVRRCNNSHFKHILTSDDLNRILRNNELRYTRNVDVVSYENGEKAVHNPEGVVVPSALWDFYANGCSIRMLNPQSYSSNVNSIIIGLQEYFGSMAGANLYLTPPGSQGFAPHYDDIEAFVVQLEGRKHWKLYEPEGPHVLARHSSGNLKREDLGQPFMEVTLEAGDLLYFSRGVIHEASTDETAHSLHITFSVYQQTSYTDLLELLLPSALKKASESDVQFRKGLPLNYLKTLGVANKDSNVSSSKETISKVVRNLIHKLSEYIDVDEAADKLGRKLMYDSMPPTVHKSETGRTVKTSGPYLKDGRVNGRVEIQLSTKIRLLRYYCLRLVVENENQPKLYYTTENGSSYHQEEEQWLELDPDMVPAIKTLISTYPDYIEIEKLPLKTDSTSLQSIADLWEHGLLVAEKPLKVVVDD